MNMFFVRDLASTTVLAKGHSESKNVHPRAVIPETEAFEAFSDLASLIDQRSCTLSTGLSLLVFPMPNAQGTVATLGSPAVTPRYVATCLLLSSSSCRFFF